MHELFVLDEILPCEAGESPFRMRGVIYNRIVEHGTRLSGSLDAFASGLADPRVRTFMGQPFRWNAPYDALPLSPVQIHLARLQRRDFESATRARAAEGAERLIPTMFRLIMGLGRPRSWALHAPRLMSEYCGVGGIRTSTVTDDRAVFELDTIPQFMAASHVNTVIGIFEGTLSLLRVGEISSRYFDVRRTGEQEGHPLLSCSLELRWG